MTTHCSPSPGATTQQLVCQGPAGNPTTSTDVNSREARKLSGAAARPSRSSLPRAAAEPRHRIASVHLPGSPEVPGAANDTEGTWPRAAAANASLPDAATSDGGCVRWSVVPSSDVATPSSAP